MAAALSVRQSTMQPAQLGIARLLRHMACVTGGGRVDHWHAGRLESTTYAEIARRAFRLGRALARRGIGPGAVVATLCSATREHFECYLGIPAHGAVLHTLNIRMHDTDIAAMIRGIGDAAIVVDATFAERFAAIAPGLAGPLGLVVVAGEGAARLAESGFHGLSAEVVDYEALLAEAGDVAPEAMLQLADPPEEAAAAVCHTGGTTGLPKAVAYSHRSLWLQATSLCTANSLGISRADTVLPAVPLYHVNGWGLPFAAAMAGAGIVLAGNSFRPDHLDGLIEGCGVTVAAGVPTIWSDLLAHRAGRGAAPFRTLRRVATGGAAVPQRLVADLAALDLEIIQAWGMTETSSMSVVGRMQPDPGPTESAAVLGQIACGLEIRVAAPGGGALPSDGTAVGEVQIRGPWVTGSYLGGVDPQAFDGDWLRTGDIGTVDAAGRLRLTDRLKDAVKSGGEWIPSQMLENVLRSLPQVADAAIIGRPDPRWQERPLAVLVVADGAAPDTRALREALRGSVPGWWIPDCWAVLDALPRTTLGKPDKARLRRMLADGELALTENAAAAAP